MKFSRFQLIKCEFIEQRTSTGSPFTCFLYYNKRQGRNLKMIDPAYLIGGDVLMPISPKIKLKQLSDDAQKNINRGVLVELDQYLWDLTVIKNIFASQEVRSAKVLQCSKMKVGDVFSMHPRAKDPCVVLSKSTSALQCCVLSQPEFIFPVYYDERRKLHTQPASKSTTYQSWLIKSINEKLDFYDTFYKTLLLI
jgi:hypothetical protein